MNILIISYQGGIAGSTYSVSFLAKGLAERGHKVVLATKKGNHAEELIKGTKVVFEPMEFLGRVSFKDMSRLKEIVEKHDIQLINAQASLDRYITILGKWWHNLNVKLVHTRRQVPKSVGGYFQNAFYTKGTDKIVAVSEGIKGDLVKMKLPATHIHVINNGTPKSKYKLLENYIPNELREKYSIAQDDFVIGSVSRLKHQEHLLKSLELIKEPVTVIFIGIDGKEPAISELISTLNISQHKILFLGTISPEESLKHYKLFDIKVLCSHMEGLSQALLEAMFIGVPVLATNMAGNPSLIKHNENGYLFENDNYQQLADQILKLKHSKTEREKLKQGGLKTANNDFSIEKTLDNYETFFQDLINDA
ncbi:glycosyltransferase family 4 protein [Aureibacter tunicatorum]|uniref:Glycosyltransferase involved in cell wall biosynthesis n=1 Tax=Aureibacter tunicatorum TaxID=866807 RepID=A0AAE3XKV2_9BACT|nr:glycosyltransferase family 4 protein [Aureibacter tunicatorum]MDR6237854.1 glycosyltransferase involved in cell wall biosynthesis [Aureibacter tunicatorum]BDD02889.1 glycosyl transferase family 1 [Aureibacter tunicatorum]